MFGAAADRDAAVAAAERRHGAHLDKSSCLDHAARIEHDRAARRVGADSEVAFDVDHAAGVDVQRAGAAGCDLARRRVGGADADPTYPGCVQGLRDHPAGGDIDHPRGADRATVVDAADRMEEGAGAGHVDDGRAETRNGQSGNVVRVGALRLDGGAALHRECARTVIADRDAVASHRKQRAGAGDGDSAIRRRLPCGGRAGADLKDIVRGLRRLGRHELAAGADGKRAVGAGPVADRELAGCQGERAAASHRHGACGPGEVADLGVGATQR